MKRYIRSSRADSSFMRQLVETAFNSVSDPDASYINIIKELNQVFETKGITLERTDGSGQYKYGDVAIKQSYFADDMRIYIEVADDFFETNENQLDYLVRVLSQIYVHEKKHMDQFIAKGGYLTDEDASEGAYHSLWYEIEAHAADAVEGFIQNGYDPRQVLEDNLWEDWGIDVESAWIYWDTYGRYDDQLDCPVWQAFLKSFEESLY